MTYLDIQYQDSRVRHSWYPIYLANLLNNRYYPHRVADLGAGTGAFLDPWLDLKVETLAADREPLASGKHPFVRADFQDPDLLVRYELRKHKQSCDLVFCKSVVEHLTDPSALFDTARLLLRPGGRLVMMTPDWRTYARVFYDDYTHVRPYDIQSLPDLFRASNFTVESAELVYQHPGLAESRVQRIAGALLTSPFREDFVCDIADRLNFPWLRWAKLKTVMVVGKPK